LRLEVRVSLLVAVPVAFLGTIGFTGMAGRSSPLAAG
jgi:hypothetical protein